MNEKLSNNEREQNGRQSGLKPYLLIDDLFETGIARHVIGRMGGDPDETCRVHIKNDQVSGKVSINSFGKAEVLEKLDQALSNGVYEHHMTKIKHYPSDENFPQQAIDMVMRPQIARTLQSWRQRKGLPSLPFENAVVQVERVINDGLNLLTGEQ